MRPMPPPRTHCAGCGAVFDDVVTPGNPPEGGALEGERTAEQERSALIDFINGAYEYDEAEGDWGGWVLVPRNTVKDLQGSFGPDALADSVCVDIIRRIERGDHIKPPAPAIPQSGDEKEERP
jgi:hypothetical protein